MKKFLSAALLSLFVVPATAFALPGVGPRVTVVGEITNIVITDQQLFDDEGGEVTILATNGQTVKAVIQDSTRIVSEGRISTKKILPRDLRTGMRVRVTGWRVGTDGVTASLLVITNVEANPGLSGNGIVSSYSNNVVTFTGIDGTQSSYTIDHDTEVNINYTIKGPDAMTIVGKQAVYSVSPSDTTRLKVLRITGEPERKAARPSIRELRTTRYRRR